MLDIIKDGQLHVFNAALAAAGLYDIIEHRGSTAPGPFMVMVGMLLVLFAAGVYFFADAASVNARLPPGQAGPIGELGALSVVMLVATVAAVLTCRALTDAL
jgi:hypothetical protein